jgi:hypothetical protein
LRSDRRHGNSHEKPTKLLLEKFDANIQQKIEENGAKKG